MTKLLLLLLSVTYSYFKISNDGNFRIADELYSQELFVLDSGNITAYLDHKVIQKSSFRRFTLLEKASSGNNALGDYKEWTFYADISDNLQATLSVKHYEKSDWGEFLIFGQQIEPTELKVSDCDDDSCWTQENQDQHELDLKRTLISWPSLKLPSESQNFYHNQLCGYMTGWTDFRANPLNENTKICDGINSGPFFITRDNNVAPEIKTIQDQMFIVSQFSEFMSGNVAQMDDQIQFGPLGSLRTIPSMFNSEVIVMISGYSTDYKGFVPFTTSIQRWGELLTSYYEKFEEDKRKDPTASKLTYYTDRGAYFYYNNMEKDCDIPNEKCNMEPTLKTVTSELKKLDLPFGAIQYDSWRYKKTSAKTGLDPSQGCVNWTARSDVFSDGGVKLFAEHKLPVIAHNRVWSANNVYKETDATGWECDKISKSWWGFNVSFFRVTLCTVSRKKNRENNLILKSQIGNPTTNETIYSFRLFL